MDIEFCTVVDSKDDGTAYTVYEYVLSCTDEGNRVCVAMNYRGKVSEYTHTSFTSHAEAREFYELARKNLATPIDAPYVFEDSFGKHRKGRI